MKERPILFSAPMVRALLAGTKTQTRRVVKPQPPERTYKVLPYHHPDPRQHFYAWVDSDPPRDTCACSNWCQPCPHGQAGDRLWVRETWNRTNPGGADGVYYYRADTHFPASIGGGPIWTDASWRPSIFMPRAASRILLTIIDVRLERLNDISADDAAAEGWPGPDAQNSIASAYPIAWYSNLWEQINGKGSWALNPWVWAVSFRVLKGPQP